MPDLKEILDSGTDYVIYLRSEEELSEFAEIWRSINGLSVSHNFLTEYAAVADLCLHLRRWRITYNWTWSSKKYCFERHPEIEVHTIDDLRVSPSDFGEIETETAETGIFDLLLEAVNDMGLLRGDSCD